MKNYCNQLMIISIVSTFFSTGLAFGAEKVKTPTIDLDPVKVEANIDTKPLFTSTSSDQKEIDKTLDNNQEQFDDLSFSHIEKLVECGALKTIDEIQKCKMDYLKIKNK